MHQGRPTGRREAMVGLFVLPVVSDGAVPATAGEWESIDAPPSDGPWPGASRTGLAMNSLALASFKRRLGWVI